MKILVLSPHPDDAEIGLGGTIHKLASQGHHCEIAVFTGQGDLHMVHNNAVVQFSQRQKEQAAAAKILGASVYWISIAPASKFDTQPLSMGVQHLDILLAKGWDALYVPLPSHNQDHNYVWQVAMAATRPSKNDKMSVFAYEQPTQFHGQQMQSTLPARWYSVLSQENVDAKCEALLQHGSQMQGRANSLVGVDGVRLQASTRGLEIGEPFAELFWPIRVVA